MTLIEHYAKAASPATAPAAPTAESGGAARSVRVCFGRRWVSPELVSQLQAGSIVELDSAAEAPAEVYADGRLAGRGSPVVVDGKLGIRLEKKD
jgi:hypothetical protein